MNIRHLLITTLLIALPAAVSAQTFTGRVEDDTGKELPAVTVMLLDEEHAPLAFTRSAGDGSFTVTAPEGKSAGAIMFSCVGFRRDTLSTKTFSRGQTVRLTPATFKIKEVKVKAQRIREAGDTLNYLVSSFAHGQDRSIADVIAKMPGLSVDKNGSISYQGRKISNFYIEGMDLLGSKYTQASENLSADKVKKVQVLRHHESTKALRDVSFSQQAALNIVLKDEVKNVWQGMAEAGMGSTLQDGAGWLGDMRLVAMLFARKRQSISMYKYNNTGKDILREVTDAAELAGNMPLEQGILRNINLTSPDLDEHRTTFNDSHLFATNWLFKPDKDSDLRLQISGLRDKSTQRGSQQTYYTDIGGEAVIAEEYDAHSYRNEIQGELKYKVNRDSLFFDNTLKGYLDFNSSDGSVMSAGRNVTQSVRPRRRYLYDRLRFIRRLSGGHNLSLSAYTSYNSLPGSLLLSDGSWQRLNISSAYWGADASLTHRAGPFVLDISMGTDGKTIGMHTVNSRTDATDRYTENLTAVSVGAKYTNQILKVSLSASAGWLTRRLNDMRSNRANLSPTVSVAVEPSACFNMQMSYSWSQTPLPFTSVVATPIFTDYMTITQGTGTLSDMRTHTASLYANYKNITAGVFASLIATHFVSSGNNVTAHTLSDGVYEGAPAGLTSDQRMTMVTGNVTKSAAVAKLNVSLSATAMINGYDIYTGGCLSPAKTVSLTATLRCSAQPAQWLSLAAMSSVQSARQSGISTADSRPYNDFSHSLRLNVMPRNVTVSVSAEVYHSDSPSVPVSFFTDIEVTYRHKAFEVGLSLNNITGTSRYCARHIYDTSRTFTVSRLRPRELTARIKLEI